MALLFAASTVGAMAMCLYIGYQLGAGQSINPIVMAFMILTIIIEVASNFRAGMRR